MKKITIISILSLLLFQQCTTRSYIDKRTFEEITSQKMFTFEAEHIRPMSNEAVSIAQRNSGSSSQLLHVGGDGYEMVISKDKITLDLPYFGVSNSFSREGNKGVHYTSMDFEIIENESKKGQKAYTISLKDVNAVNNIYLDVYNNGSAYLSINFRDKQPISYDGFIKQNAIEK